MVARIGCVGVDDSHKRGEKYPSYLRRSDDLACLEGRPSGAGTMTHSPNWKSGLCVPRRNTHNRGTGLVEPW